MLKLAPGLAPVLLALAACGSLPLPPTPGAVATGPAAPEGTGTAARPDIRPCDPRDPKPKGMALIQPLGCTVSPTAPPSNGLLFVDVKSTVTGNGSSDTPFRSIKAATDYATAGATITVRSGEYRETAEVKVEGLSLLAEPGAVIKGSDVVTGWTQEGSYWVTPYAHNANGSRFYVHGSCRATSNNRCRYPDQAYLDGLPQFQETALAAVGPGDFWVGNGKLYLGSDPTGRTVELAARTHWVRGSSSAHNAVVKGFVMKHAGNQAQAGALTDGNANGWLVEGNELLLAHAIGLKLDGNDSVARANLIHTNGQMGVSASTSSGQRWLNNEVAHNQTEDYYPGWEGGGSKFVRARFLLVQGNHFHHNDGPGIWCDIDCGWDPVLLKPDPADSVRILGNRVHHHSWYGIAYEISYSALIEFNHAWENGHTDSRGWLWDAGIACQNSSFCTVRNNVSVWNADGISGIRQARGENGVILERWTTVTNVVMTGNLVATTGDHMVEFRSDTTLYAATNVTAEPNECHTGPDPTLTAKLEPLGIPSAPEPR